MTLKEFEEKYCHLCGTQRCDPRDIEWLKGCKHFQELDSTDKAKILSK